MVTVYDFFPFNSQLPTLNIQYNLEPSSFVVMLPYNEDSITEFVDRACYSKASVLKLP